jgi:DNA-binding SARP family transcriptional activator
MSRYRANLADLLARKGAWDEVYRETEAWLRLDPGDATAHMLHIKCLLRAGKRADANAEFTQVEALRPPNLSEFQKWFARESSR